jgi:hypothetical protein
MEGRSWIMHVQPQSGGGRTLLSILPHERVQVESIQFPTLHALCADLGFDVGSTLLARVVTPRVLLLDTADGRTIQLDADWAQFIGIRDLPPAA